MGEKAIRVLHLISTLDLGGAEQNLSRLLESMDRSSFVNEVVCMTAPGILARRIEESGIPVHSLKMRKGIPEIRAVLRLRFIASMFRPQVIQCWMYHANLLGLSLFRPGQTLWNIRCSDMDLSLYGAMYRITVRAGAGLSRLPSSVIANSQAGRKAHETMGYHPKKWIIIPNGFDCTHFRPDPAARLRIRSELGIPPDAFVTGVIGRFDPMKDHGTFFRAAELFSTRHARAHFVLAGRGVSENNQAFRDIMGTAPGNPRYHLLGERHDVAAILASLDTAVSSSISEGLPNAIGEAMACAVPCIATDAGDTGYLLGDTGMLVKIRSPQDLAAAMETIAGMNREKRLSLGAKARQRIMQGFTQEKTTEHYQDIYRQLAGIRLSDSLSR